MLFNNFLYCYLYSKYMLKKLINNYKSKAKKEFIEISLIFILLIFGLFIHIGFIGIILIYLFLNAIYDIYETYKIAYNYPSDIHKPISDNRGYGMFVLGAGMGLLNWFYLYNQNYFSSEFSIIVSFIFIGLLIPTLIASFFLIYSIDYIQRYVRGELL